MKHTVYACSKPCEGAVNLGEVAVNLGDVAVNLGEESGKKENLGQEE